MVAITLEALHAKEIIEQAFEHHGMPEIVNTDQGGLFTDEEFTRVALEAGCRLSIWEWRLERRRVRRAPLEQRGMSECT